MYLRAMHKTKPIWDLHESCSLPLNQQNFLVGPTAVIWLEPQQLTPPLSQSLIYFIAINYRAVKSLHFCLKDLIWLALCSDWAGSNKRHRWLCFTYLSKIRFWSPHDLRTSRSMVPSKYPLWGTFAVTHKTQHSKWGRLGEILKKFSSWAELTCLMKTPTLIPWS